MKMFRVNIVVALLVLVLSVGTTSAQVVIPTPVEMTQKGDQKVKITRVDAAVDSSLKLPDEGYTLEIKGASAILRAKTEQGLVWAKATLAQLKDEEGAVPVVKIKDYPAFPIRGFMNDCGRNFRPVHMLKADIDLLSFYKMNLFHWHLTDNPAWRIESKSYPVLNAARYHQQTRNAGMFYSYDDIREVMRYAKERGITVIPEIDIPSHSQYFWTIFGFQMEDPRGMKILDVLFEEFLTEILADLCPYIHIGSDEVRRKIDDAEGFVRHYEELIAKHNRKIVIWDPGITPSSKETILQSVRAMESRKANTMETVKYGKDDIEILKKHPIIDSSMGYLNHGSPFNNISRYFLRQMCGAEQCDGHALGGILCLWNDVRVASYEQLMPINAVPISLLPFAERAWVGGKGYGVDFEALVPAPETEGYRDLLAFEQKMIYHRDHHLQNYAPRWVANAHIPWQVTVPQPQGTPKESMKWVKAYGASLHLFALALENGVTPSEKMVAHLKTEIYSEEERDIRALVSFETPSRSTRRSAGIGKQGEWETGGTILVNGEKVLPPQAWEQPGEYAYHFSAYKYRDIQDIPWTNEQLFWMREPAKIHLKKGWNSVEIEAPLHYSTPFWYVSFSPVEVGADGIWREVKGLKYR